MNSNPPPVPPGLGAIRQKKSDHQGSVESFGGVEQMDPVEAYVQQLVVQGYDEQMARQYATKYYAQHYSQQKKSDVESQNISKAKADLLDQVKATLGPKPNFIDVIIFWISPISSVIICSGVLLSFSLIAIYQFLGGTEYGLALLFLIPLYIVIVPLISMAASLMEDYSKLDTLDAIIKSVSNSVVGSIIFLLLLYVTVAGDQFDEVVDTLDISHGRIFLIVIGINVFSSFLGTSFNLFINRERGPL